MSKEATNDRAPEPDHRHVARTRRARTAVQRSEPSGHLTDTLELVEEMTALNRSREQVSRSIELLAGVRYGELEALTAVAEGADHFRQVARRTGQTDAAARATVEGLVGRGLLDRHPHESATSGEPAALVHLTQAGAVVLHQAEALQLRLLDAVVESLDGDDSERLRAAISRVSRTFDPQAAPRVGLPAAIVAAAT